MLHPQFDDIIIELSKYTHVEWITNGTMLDSSKMKRIITESNTKNIHQIIVSIHVTEIDKNQLLKIINQVTKLRIDGLTVHMNALVTKDTINHLIQYKNIFNHYGVKVQSPYPVQKLNDAYVHHDDNSQIRNLCRLNNIKIDEFFVNRVSYPYKGNICPHGRNIF
jgi:hypothetical protein